MKANKEKPRYVICIQNEGCDYLEQGKLYQVLVDESVKQESYLRIIDESG